MYSSVLPEKNMSNMAKLELEMNNSIKCLKSILKCLRPLLQYSLYPIINITTVFNYCTCFHSGEDIFLFKEAKKLFAPHNFRIQSTKVNVLVLMNFLYSIPVDPTKLWVVSYKN